MKDLFAVEAGLEADTIEAKMYVKYHKIYGLKIEWLNSEYINKFNKHYIIKGLYKKGRLVLVILFDENTNQMNLAEPKHIIEFKQKNQ